jgi:hypothetical protein
MHGSVNNLSDPYKSTTIIYPYVNCQEKWLNACATSLI